MAAKCLSLATTIDFLARCPECWESGQEFACTIVLKGTIVGACGLFRRDDTSENGREIG